MNLANHEDGDKLSMPADLVIKVNAYKFRAIDPKVTRPQMRYLWMA
jgi:hypothetical protein